MSKADRVKEEIGWLKVVFGILVATDISIIAWLAQNFGSASRIQVLVGLAAVVGVTGAVDRAALHAIGKCFGMIMASTIKVSFHVLCESARKSLGVYI